MLVGLITHRPDSQFKRAQIFDKDGKERNMIRNVVWVKFVRVFKNFSLEWLIPRKAIRDFNLAIYFLETNTATFTFKGRLVTIFVGKEKMFQCTKWKRLLEKLPELNRLFIMVSR